MSQQTFDPLFTHRVNQVRLDPDELRANLAAADPAILLVSLVQVTGDVCLLDRFADRIGTSFRLRDMPDARPPQETPEEVRADLIDRLCEALARTDQPAYLGVEDRTLFSRMADIVAETHVDDQYIDMYLEQTGFVADQRRVPPTKTPPATLNIAIIGAGMTGLDAAVKAAARGFTYQVFDRESGVGGLWWTQTYPGVGVDTPSMFYSLSYEVTPDWSAYFPLGREYRAYLQHLADKYGVTDHVHLNTEITRMEWIEDDQVWELTAVGPDHTPRTLRAAAVIAAAGHFNAPKYPDVDGRDTFADSVHTVRWNNGLDLTGRRVGVVGAGAAAIQVIAAIAGDVEHLTVFQRQPHWVVPNMVGDGVVSEGERWLRRHLPYYLQWSRFRAFWMAGDEFGYPMMRVDQDWTKDHPTSISPYNEAAMHVCLDYINSTFGEGSELAKKLTPEFAMGGKRPVRDPGDFQPGGYYYALSQPHVDVETEQLAKVVPEGILTADGALHELDVIIYATGMTIEWLASVEIIGRDGRRLTDVWADNNPRSYLGGTVPGFPNLFINDGPNTGVGHAGGHNFMTETVDHYAFECLQIIVNRGARSIEVTQEAHDAHNERLDEKMKGSIWAHELHAHTYYRNEAGRVIFPSPWRLVEYWEMSQCPIESHFIIR